MLASRRLFPSTARMKRPRRRPGGEMIGAERDDDSPEGRNKRIDKQTGGEPGLTAPTAGATDCLD